MVGTRPRFGNEANHRSPIAVWTNHAAKRPDFRLGDFNRRIGPTILRSESSDRYSRRSNHPKLRSHIHADEEGHALRDRDRSNTWSDSTANRLGRRRRNDYHSRLDSLCYSNDLAAPAFHGDRLALSRRLRTRRFPNAFRHRQRRQSCRSVGSRQYLHLASNQLTPSSLGLLPMDIRHYGYHVRALVPKAFDRIHEPGRPKRVREKALHQFDHLLASCALQPRHRSLDT